ncbi:MAG: GatB/YqeY domain-containing protein [Candidatus Methylopumilus sp.]|nr:GatB/YqeY domain-containing protein [Candidatus Methylopumilus sp.]
MSLKVKITEDMKEAMRAKDVTRLGTIRLLQSAIKQREVDERIELNDQDVMAVIEKMLKQRRDSIEAYTSAQRQDLVDVEKAEVVILQSYLPQALTDVEVIAILDAAIKATNATSIKEMGQVMAIVKPKVVGRADMGKLSSLIKEKLS